MQIVIPEQRRVKWFSSPFQKGMQDIGGKQAFTTLGYFTHDSVDQAGDVITRDATEKATPRWKKWGNIRFQHDSSRPVGKTLKIGMQDGLEWNQCLLKCVDPEVQRLIDEDVISALSVGIIVEEAEPVDPAGADDPFWFLFGGIRVLSYKLVEISYVDIPCQENAVLTGHAGDVVAVQNASHALEFKSANWISGLQDKGFGNPAVVMSKSTFGSEAVASKWLETNGMSIGKITETKSNYTVNAFDVDYDSNDLYVVKSAGSGAFNVFKTEHGAGKTFQVPEIKTEELPDPSVPTAEKQDEPVTVPEVTESQGNGPNLDLGRKSVDELNKTVPAPVVETQPEAVAEVKPEPQPEVKSETVPEAEKAPEKDKLDIVIEMLQKLLEKQEAVTEVKAEAPKPEESTPEVKLATEVVEPKDDLDKKLDGMLDKVTKAIADANTAQQQWTQEYIASLNTAEEGKAQVKQVKDEPAPEPVTPDEIKKAMHAKLASIFEQKSEVK